jgi:hypothetical protein
LDRRDEGHHLPDPGTSANLVPDLGAAALFVWSLERPGDER